MTQPVVWLKPAVDKLFLLHRSVHETLQQQDYENNFKLCCFYVSVAGWLAVLKDSSVHWLSQADGGLAVRSLPGRPTSLYQFRTFYNLGIYVGFEHRCLFSCELHSARDHTICDQQLQLQLVIMMLNSSELHTEAAHRSCTQKLESLCAKVQN